MGELINMEHDIPSGCESIIYDHEGNLWVCTVGI